MSRKWCGIRVFSLFTYIISKKHEERYRCFMDFETLKNDFLLADGASAKIRFATKNWVIWATLFTLTEDVSVVYYVDAAKNRDDVQKYGFSFEEKADLAAFVNRKTCRTITSETFWMVCPKKLKPILRR